MDLASVGNLDSIPSDLVLPPMPAVLRTIRCLLELALAMEHAFAKVAFIDTAIRIELFSKTIWLVALEDSFEH